MNIIVIGCGRVGAELAYRLFRKGHKVSVIDQNASSFNNLPADFLGRTIDGEALTQNVLHRAGIETADGLAAVTSSDTTNAVVAHIARIVYNIPIVVIRNYDPAYRMMHEAFGLQLISSSSWGAQRIEEMLYHGEIRTVFSAGNGEVEIYEFLIPKQWHNHRLSELIPSEECVPVSLTRAGKALIPDRDSRLLEGDIILVSSTFDGIQNMRMRLRKAQEI
jgi:trk system potassium uptake protein TrkA